MPITNYIIDPNTLAILLKVDDPTVIEVEMQKYYTIIDKVMKAGVMDYMDKNNFDEDEKVLIKQKLDTYISIENTELKTDELLKTFLAKEDLQDFLAELAQSVNKSYYEQYYPSLDQAKKDELTEYIFDAKQLTRRSANHLLNLLDFVDEKKIEEDIKNTKKQKPTSDVIPAPVPAESPVRPEQVQVLDKPEQITTQPTDQPSDETLSPKKESSFVNWPIDEVKKPAEEEKIINSEEENKTSTDPQDQVIQDQAKPAVPIEPVTPAVPSAPVVPTSIPTQPTTPAPQPASEPAQPSINFTTT